jgi:hypothetical protein
LVETFDDDRREDPLHTTALWGPPENPGELRGALGPGCTLKTPLAAPVSAVLRFADGRPAPGTEAILLWEGARQSLDVHGALEPFSGGGEDPRTLGESEWLRFTLRLFSSPSTRAVPAIDEIRLDFGDGP